MLHRSKSKDRQSIGGPVFMNPDQMTNYLTDLRTNRPARPTGARPPPSSFKSVRHAVSNFEMSTSHSRSSMSSGRSSEGQQGSPDAKSAPYLPMANPKRNSSSISARTLLGRPLVRSPAKETEEDLIYQETSGARWMERQEARSLRMALEDMDSTGKDEEEKWIFEAAQKEAGELVWKHQNGGETAVYPTPNPDTLAPAGSGAEGADENTSVLVAHLQKGSHARSLSRGAREGLVMKKREGNRSASGSSTGSGGSSRQVSDGSVKSLNSSGQGSERASRKRSVQFAVSSQELKDDTPIAILPRAPSTGIEEKQEPKHSGVLNSMHFRNPFARARNSRSSLGSLHRPSSCPPTDTRLEKVEIQRNPPTQSRKPDYTVNQPSPPTTSSGIDEELKMKDGIEIRSDDIRKATSMSLKDRSAKLPSPSMVSDSPGRPIVSFDKDWKPKEVKLEQQKAVPDAPKEAPKPYPAHLRHVGSRNSLPPMPFKIYEDKSVNNQVNQSRTSLDQQPVTTTQSHSRNNSEIITTANPMPSIPTINIPDDSPVPRTRSYVRPLNVADKSSISISVSKPPIPAKSPLRQASGSTPPIPSINFPDDPPIKSSTRPQIPVINLPDDPPATNIPTISIDVPSININGAAPAPPTIAINDTPSISISSDSPTHSSSRPLPKPGARGRPFRPAPPPSQTGSNSSIRGATVLCHACAFPIAGRIVTAAGCRFHPGCFRCHHCSEALECVAFYPEPDGMYEERKNRILKRMHGEHIEEGAEEDGDDGIRFFCHLDFHEFFSPRCKSCKTPIEGDVVVACGAEWHAGHFFCAQCGDPFDATTPYVEKDGYAWCVNCHTHRYSTKCKKCRKPVIDTVVKALGAEWHEDCFCCTECKSRFVDGRYFLRQGGDDPYCPACEERRLKSF